MGFCMVMAVGGDGHSFSLRFMTGQNGNHGGFGVKVGKWSILPGAGIVDGVSLRLDLDVHNMMPHRGAGCL